MATDIHAEHVGSMLRQPWRGKRKLELVVDTAEKVWG